MKTKIDGVLIVEGKEDVSFLSSFIDTLFFTTGGCDLSKEKLDFLLEASKVNKLIVFTDNDKAGEELRNKIKNEIQGVYVALLNGNSRLNYKKHGVAEAKKEDILIALKEHISDIDRKIEKYDLSKLSLLNENPQIIKDEIIKKYHLLKGSNKSLENQLNILKIKKEDVWKLIDQTLKK